MCKDSMIQKNKNTFNSFTGANNEESLADEALSHARELFDFADNYPGYYTDVIPADDYYA